MVEVVPDTWGKQELAGEGETKMSFIAWPKNSPACGGWRASPLSLISARSGMWLTRTWYDQAAAWYDGGELELSQTLRLCRTCSTSSSAEGKRSTAHDNRGSYSMRYLRPLWCGIAGGADGYDSHGEVIDVARGIGLHKHGRW